MNNQEHKDIHLALHKSLDKLLADWIAHAEGSLDQSIYNLMVWSFDQTKNPVGK